MQKVRSCGVIVFRAAPQPAFLLLRLPNRLDLPKGHSHSSESDLACALRELEEETGIAPGDIRLDEGFRIEQVYYPRYKSLGGAVVEKTLVLFLGLLLRDRDIRLTEHVGYEWFPWLPPHAIQPQGIDPILLRVAAYFARAGTPWPSTTTT